jgi:hypothetical protein
MSEPRDTIRLSLADLVSVQSHVAVALAFALERRGLVSCAEVADDLSHIAGGLPDGSPRALVRVLADALRLDARPEPAAPDLTLIRGGKG